MTQMTNYNVEAYLAGKTVNQWLKRQHLKLLKLRTHALRFLPASISGSDLLSVISSFIFIEAKNNPQKVIFPTSVTLCVFSDNAIGLCSPWLVLLIRCTSQQMQLPHYHSLRSPQCTAGRSHSHSQCCLLHCRIWYIMHVLQWLPPCSRSLSPVPLPSSPMRIMG